MEVVGILDIRPLHKEIMGIKGTPFDPKHPLSFAINAEML
jgi:hypothetical protein